jgi:predicted transcriptional regulator
MLERERRVVELSIQGWRQDAIAAELGVSQAAVSKILARAEARHLEEIGTRITAQKARQTMRLENVYAQSMQAWAQSKADATKRRQRQTHGEAGASQQIAEVVSENRHGDPRYLAEARGALKDLRALYGLDAPTKVVVTGTPFDDMSDVALAEALATQRRLLELPASEPTPIDTTTNTGEDRE